MRLKVMCMQPAMYLALESSCPDMRLVGLTPHICNPPLEPPKTRFEADCLSGCALPRPFGPGLRGVLFSPVSAFCLLRQFSLPSVMLLQFLSWSDSILSPTSLHFLSPS